jgi:hypothetical protein
MGLFLLRFWPVLIPLIVYLLWITRERRRAHKSGTKLPKFLSGPWFTAVITSLAIGMAIFLFLGFTHTQEKGNYIPSHVENGQIVPGKVVP